MEIHSIEDIQELEVTPIEMENLEIDDKASRQHEFSTSWEDSDLVLVVEDQKLHVHRLILKMASPVFKAMFSADFKEKHSREIQLPGKKANEFICLLRQIYPQFRQEITLDNVEYIYSLADEYQMTKEMDACKKFLASVQKTASNAMRILVLAQFCHADEARQQCYDVLRQMSMNKVKEDDMFTALDGQSSQAILLPKIEDLQQCIREALPQMLGLISRLLHVMSLTPEEGKGKTPSKRPPPPHICSEHSPKSDFPFFTRMNAIINCDSCKATWVQLATGYSGTHYKSKEIQLNNEIVKVIEKMAHLSK